MSVQPHPEAAGSGVPGKGIVTIRHQLPQDLEWIETLHALAFGPGRYARAAFRVRERFPLDPDLSLVAELDERPVSSVWMTPISLSGIDGYLLGPLATDPAFRGRGAARMLVREVTRRALARGEGHFVLLVGDYPYYGPLGFERTSPGAIVFPGPVDPERVLAHTPDAGLASQLKGQVAAFGAR
ncbi:MAG TPA: N-acetyltransferase [Devosiaceae bacterium]